jgi:hypothetical protein
MEAAGYSETLVTFYRLHGIASCKIIAVVVTPMKNSNLTNVFELSVGFM